MTFCSRLEVTSDVISSRAVRQIVLDKRVKFLRDPSLNHSRKIPPIPVGGSIFDSFFRYDFRSEVDNDIIPGVAV